MQTFSVFSLLIAPGTAWLPLHAFYPLNLLVDDAHQWASGPCQRIEDFLHKLLLHLFLYQMGEVLIREDFSRMIPYFLPHIKTEQDEVFPQ